MKRINTYLLISMLLLASASQAQIIFQENFNGTNPLSNWTLFNVDNRTPATNVNYVNAAWVVRADFDSTGTGDNIAVSTSWYTPAGAADDYMISPAIALTSNNILEFDAKAQDPAYPDGYEVRISTTVPTVAGLLANPALFTTSGEQATWIRRSINLATAGYANQTVYIAWRNNSTDMFLLDIDNIKVHVPLALDARLDQLNLPKIAQVGTNVPVSGTIKNNGTNTLTSIYVNWSANGGTVNTDTVSLNLSTSNSTTFTHSMNLTAANVGNFTNLKVWLSSPNGGVDLNKGNDTLNAQVFVNTGVTVSRKAVLEEFTTAGCQFCPDGAVVVEQVLAANPNVIGIGVHSCFGTDAMTNSSSSGLCSTLGNQSAPTAMIDRIIYPGETSAAVGRSTWQARANARSLEGSPVGINMTGTYNAATRAVSVTVAANFVDYTLPGNLNMTLSLLEDSVTGTGSGYNQSNAYNNQAGHQYAGKGNPIVGYIHRHVLRANLPSTFGDATVIPASVALNTPYSKTFTFNVPATWNAERMSFVGMVNYAGPGIENYQILNAEELHIGQLATGIEKQASSVQSVELSPNPTEDYSYIRFNLTQNSNVTVSVFDITGKLVQLQNLGQLSKGKQQAIVDATALENGFYFVNLKVGENQITKKISVMH